jgi:hypothetical protein
LRRSLLAIHDSLLFGPRPKIPTVSSLILAMIAVGLGIITKRETRKNYCWKFFRKFEEKPIRI